MVEEKVDLQLAVQNRLLLGVNLLWELKQDKKPKLVRNIFYVQDVKV
jgi:hypothetical protein